MTQPCTPEFNIVPLPCGSADGPSPGPIDVAGCCSPSIALTTLCLDDCSPVSIVVRSGCVECSATPGEPQAVGWLDAAGVFTPGAPPAGARSCDGCNDPPPCEPVSRCPGLVGLSDGETWTAPPGTESVHVNVICAPVIVTPCAGDDTVTIQECGSMSWSAPGDACTPGQLCPGFAVEIPPGSAAYIAYVTTNCGGTP